MSAIYPLPRRHGSSGIHLRCGLHRPYRHKATTHLLSRAVCGEWLTAQLSKAWAFVTDLTEHLLLGASCNIIPLGTSPELAGWGSVHSLHPSCRMVRRLCKGYWDGNHWPLPAMHHMCCQGLPVLTGSFTCWPSCPSYTPLAIPAALPPSHAPTHPTLCAACVTLATSW